MSRAIISSIVSLHLRKVISILTVGVRSQQSETTLHVFAVFSGQLNT